MIRETKSSQSPQEEFELPNIWTARCNKGTKWENQEERERGWVENAQKKRERETGRSGKSDFRYGERERTESSPGKEKKWSQFFPSAPLVQKEG
jgi:hypothetical protein